jgi:predicted component of type VI protein secretion system
MITYQLNGSPFDINTFQVIEDVQYPVGWFHDKANRDAMGVTEVEVPDPVVTPAVPVSVTMRQARLALLQAGKLSSVDAAIASMPSPQKEAAQIEWEFSSAVDRDRAITQMLGSALGMSEADIDNLFIIASTL